jgi:hypothetical protein
VHPHAAAELGLTALARDANAQAPDLADELRPLQVEVRDWTGPPVGWAVQGDLDPAGGRVQLLAPATAERGRYSVVVRSVDDDGAVAEQRLGVNLGTRFRLAVLAPPQGLDFVAQPGGPHNASLGLRNLGNAPAGSLAVLAEGLPPGSSAEALLVLANGTELLRPLADGFARFAAADLLPPGAGATLRVSVRAAQGVPAGEFHGRLLVAGESA